jgi:hypothetical protein
VSRAESLAQIAKGVDRGRREEFFLKCKDGGKGPRE